MWCGAKFGSGYRCMRSQLYQMLVDEPKEVSAEPEVFFYYPEILESIPFEDPMISLHALLDTRGPQTMRLQGSIKNHKIIILVDTGSTQNFIYHLVVKRLGCRTHSVPIVHVTVANGNKMVVKEGCKGVNWETQGMTYNIDFLVLTLMGCDLVLGVH